MSNKIKHLKEFALTTFSVRNRKTVYLILSILIIGGISSYISMPREAFPEIEVPNIFVTIPYPGNSPDIIKDKIIKPFEKKLNKVQGIDKIKSTSAQDFGIVIIEFDFDVDPNEAKRLVDDALSEARSDKDFAKDLPIEPSVAKMDMNDMPIVNINISGDYPVKYLKEKAEYLKDKIEGIPEISSADIRGVQDQKLKIEIRKFDAEARQVSSQDIENAIRNDNVAIGAGNLSMDGISHFLLIDGKFNTVEEIKNIIVKHEGDVDVRMSDVADVSFGDVDISSFARQNGHSVVMIDVKKRSGSNIIHAIDQVRVIVDEAYGTAITKKGIEITYTNDFSEKIREQVSNLENSIIFGVLLVVGVLLFFLGLRNALYVGIAIPISMFLSFMLLNTAGVTLNIMVLFSLVLALGMLVDNGIVVIENIYRLMEEKGYNSFDAAIKGVGEVAWPIIASTATTLAAFIPLAFWPGIMGEFMFYLPVTLIIVLGSSLFVALVINPVLAAVTMKLEQKAPNKKRVIISSIILIGISALAFFSGHNFWGSLIVVVALFSLLNAFILFPLAKIFQTNFLTKIENIYFNTLSYIMKGKRPIWIVIGAIGLLISSIILIVKLPPRVEFFPVNQPNFFNVFVELPKGSDIEKTNEMTKEIKSVIDEVISKNGFDTIRDIEMTHLEDGSIHYDTIPFIETILEQVGKGTGDDRAPPTGEETPHKSKITVVFCEFSHREGVNTSNVLIAVEDSLRHWGYADVNISVQKEANGPPQEPPINIEVTGTHNYVKLVESADRIKHYLNVSNIEGMRELQANVKINKAEIEIKLDREYLRKSGMSTGQIGSVIRTSLFGKDVSTFNVEDESYDVNIRMAESFRGDIDALLDTKIMFMNHRGVKLNIPIRSVVKSAKINYKNSSIERLNLENTVTVYANVMEGFNGNEIIAIAQEKMSEFDESPLGVRLKEDGIKYKFTGQLVQQAEEMAFLSKALLIAIFLILLIIVSQFNSFSIPFIILSSVVLSLMGVFIGIVIGRNDFIIIMTMIGIISLAGIVVNNAIVLVDYTNLLRIRKRKELELSDTEDLSNDDVIQSIIEGGKTRLRPVMLTAITTILGLLPMAVGLNLDFYSLLAEFDPKIFFGGDNAIFFGPMSWTIIYGLTFATFLTLIVVPAMYYLFYRLKKKMLKTFGWTVTRGQ